MHPNSVFDVIGALLTVFIVSIVLTKKNTSADVTASGNAFNTALTTVGKG